MNRPDGIHRTLNTVINLVMQFHDHYVHYYVQVLPCSISCAGFLLGAKSLQLSVMYRTSTTNNKNSSTTTTKIIIIIIIKKQLISQYYWSINISVTCWNVFSARNNSKPLLVLLIFSFRLYILYSSCLCLCESVQLSCKQFFWFRFTSGWIIFEWRILTLLLLDTSNLLVHLADIK